MSGGSAPHPHLLADRLQPTQGPRDETAMVGLSVCCWPWPVAAGAGAGAGPLLGLGLGLGGG